MGAEIVKGGIKKAGSSTVFIPLSAETNGKLYKNPDDFKEKPDEAFTLCPGDKIARGIVEMREGEPLGETIMKVAVFDYGSLDLQHWEVSCE